MQHYGVRDVEKMLRLPRSTIRALASAGFVTPVRGPRNALLFSFQDLIVLRAAQTLADAKVPAKRISRSLRQLRRQLPQTMPLSGLSISAVGEQVVVRDGAGQRQVESGQYVLDFEGDPGSGSLSVIERAAPAAPAGQIDWFARGEALEREDPGAAIDAYRKAMAAAPDRLDVRINLGRLLHETGRHRDAERAYREAIGACGRDPLLLYNLGVLLGDLGRGREAIEAYEAALRRDPAMADSHYNLALLYEKLGKAKEAIRHMSEYRRLMRS
ncbi:MAG: tetratricopeptide repeat protein [Betaproteobacteria bacterium]|nr:MAG: tetratricopeptide repeat protein [Betaproteobacteria bacterium]